MEQSNQATPQLFFETVNAYQRSAAIKTAVELDIFTKIAEGNDNILKIAQACNASEKGVRVLCDTLTILGFLHKQNGNYALTEASTVFLNKHSPAYMGGITDFLLSPMLLEGFENLTEAVRKGGTAIKDDGSVSPENPVWVQFARAMMPMMMPAAQMMASQLDADSKEALKILDIAAGHGIFGITLAQRFQNAEVYAVDWANVLEVAQENAEKFGVANRFHKIAGSAFEADFGGNYDVVLLTNFLHHFDPSTCETLLRKINAAMNENGKVLTLEFVPNDDRVSPPTEAMFSLVMLASTPKGDAYTFTELSKMFESAGFSSNEHITLEPLPQHLIASTK
ncbi:MAG: methyltransferase domain-containing protein [Acidobacteria bacterium]|nr:methyltransferase domain-containing protein [Acidobacteriota bacterium]MCA1636992.1 methyltransferase domain-containing protein [Acidobacteriota bacterium]